MNFTKRLTSFLGLFLLFLFVLLVSFGGASGTAVVAAQNNDPLQIVADHLDQNRAEYGLQDADLSDFIVTDMYQTSDTGLTHIYLRQRVNGIEVWTGNLNANVMRDGTILTLNSAFVPNVNRASYTGQPALTAAQALKSAAQELNWAMTGSFTVQENLGGADQRQVLSAAGVSSEAIPAKLVYVTGQNNDLILAWEVVVDRSVQSGNWWQMTIDATTGKVLQQLDWVTSHNAAEIALSDARVPDGGASYRVFPFPYESPTDPGATHSLVSNPHDVTASPFGWHDTNGVAGAEFTTTQGNNVDAYTDTNADNSPDAGSRPDGGGGLTFDIAFDPAQGPTGGTNQAAAVVNLFYWNNVTHDLLYRHGFNELSGNFQVNNYGNGGLGNDSVQAEAQDGAGTNNANFATPADGSRPRMQMFTWNTTTPNRDGDFDAGIIAHEYGHGWSNRLTGGPSNVGCLNNSEQMGEGWSDFLSVIFTAQASDTRTTTRGVGTYALGQPPTGVGIRPAPYTTDMGVNNFTYSNLSSMAIPHGVGFVWNTMLWEVYWNLVDEHGFNPNLYQDYTTGGNNLTLRLVSDGLKIQPCSPGFVDGRDAILAADVALTGGANQCLIWEAFAKRGLGFSASQGAATSTSDGTAAFDMPNACMTVAAAPASQDICQGQPAAYTINVGSSYTPPVNMSATGNPAPSTATFSPNPVVTVPTTTTLTIGNTATVAPGAYVIAVTGADGSVTDTVDVDLNVFAGAPSAATLTSPADNSTGVGVAPTLTWSAVANATDYLVEVATDAGFSNIIYSNTVAGTSDSLTGLGASTEYFWRVTTNNPCGTGATSSTFSFTTAALYCGSVGALPDTSSVSFSVVIPDSGEITDLDLSINANHTWVGDMSFTLVHEATGTSVTAIDRPGTTGTGAGCSANDVDVLLDDEGTDGPVENQCATTPPALFGNPTPNNPLSAFDGQDLSGTWRLDYTDSAGGDTGTLNEWCIIPAVLDTDYGVTVDAAVLDQAGDAGTTVAYTIDITNTGILSDSYSLGAVSSEGWTVSVNPATVTLNVGEGTSVELSVEIPANAVGATVDSTTFTATSQGNGSVTDSLVVQTTVNDTAIDVNPTSMEATVAVDGTADQTLTISNIGGSNLDWNITEDAGRGPVGNIVSTIVRGTGVADASAAAELVGATAATAAVSPAGKVEVFAPTAVLYDNGSVVNSPGTGPAGADESRLQDASLTMGTFGFGHQSANNNSMADDFVIPAGENWVIDTVTFFAYQTGSTTTSTITGYNYNLYDGDPSAGGVLLFSGNTILNSVWSGAYRVLESAPGGTTRPIMATTVDFGGLALGQGTYWLEWQAAGSLGSGPWAPPITINGQSTTGNGLQNLAGTWSAATDVGQQGLPFVIEGSSGCSSDVPWLSAAPASGTTAVGGSDDVTITYDATGYAAGVYTGTLCVNSNDPVTPQITVPVTMTVSEAGVDLGPDAALSGLPGQTVTYTVAITNTGVNTDTYNLALAGSTWTTSLAVSTIELMAGETSSVEVTVDIPAGAAGNEMDMATLTATSQTDGSISDAADLTTTAEAVHSFEMTSDTTGHSAAAGETVTYTISLTNTGNITDSYTISLAGHSWSTTSSHASMMLGAGESADFTVTVTVDAGASAPDSDTTTVTVTSDADGSVTASMDLTTSVTQVGSGIFLPFIMKP